MSCISKSLKIQLPTDLNCYLNNLTKKKLNYSMGKNFYITVRPQFCLVFQHKCFKIHFKIHVSKQAQKNQLNENGNHVFIPH